MKKSLGITLLFLVICAVTAWQSPNFLRPYNVENLVHWTSLYGIVGIGAALVIVTGGIDLSIGSVMGLTGTLLPWLLVQEHWSVPAALGASLGVSLVIGLIHGLLITVLKLQPFIVTLCGLLIYRGIARWFTHDQTQGFGEGFDTLRWISTGNIPLVGGYAVRMSLVFLLVLGGLAALFLNQTVWGRHLLALGRNEEAARYSGVRTQKLLLLAYVLCSVVAGLGGVLLALETNTVQPDVQGNYMELYAIAAAVLGGCSLRGGEGSIFGVMVGAAVMRVLRNSINLLMNATQMEFAIIGVVILLGVIADEGLRKWRKV